MISGCNNNRHVKINGQFNPPERTTIKSLEQPLHYKYSEKLEKTITSSEDGKFSFQYLPDSLQIIFLEFGDHQYPVVLIPGHDLEIHINKNEFPKDVTVAGYPADWNNKYQAYLDDIAPLDSALSSEEYAAFRNSEPNNILEIHKKRIGVAEQHLTDTPLERYYFYNIGEYLNRGFQNISNHISNNKNIDADSVRSALVEYAIENDFFSFYSLWSQRAGIRDFAHHYSMSFGIQDSIISEYGEELMEYDIKRLGYDSFDTKKREVLSFVTEPRARAYAEMHIVAERLGEMPLDAVESTYFEFLDKYSRFNEYTDFISGFYREMKGVSPGNPAVPFNLPDREGNYVTMSDFEGKFLLLDFWASWCIPCLDEFPHMQRVYENTSRDHFEIVAISTEEDSLRWIESIERFDNPWIQLYGGNGFQQETFQAYSGGGIPFYILVNPEGNIARYNDVRASFNLESVLDSLMTNRPGL
ncbi:MAG: TlpA family protein disulfide reductase [Balneolaceae bacterium]